MTGSLRPLCDWIDQAEWPHVTCPVCGEGRATAEAFSRVSSGAVESLKEHEGWDPDWDSGAFHGLLRCGLPKCREPVLVVGEFRIESEVQSVDAWRGGYASLLRLRFAQPSLVLLDCPAGTPEAVVRAVAAAAALVWADPGAAANRLRLAIEELLTAQDVPRLEVGGTGRRTLSAHRRIESFRARNADAADALMAVKWIGNEGSHADALTAADVLDGAAMLGTALRLLYDRSDEEMRRRIAAINNSGGLRRAAAPPEAPA